MEVAGAGYINFVWTAPQPFGAAGLKVIRRYGKVIVEHTNINPNKAAHIGHLRMPLSAIFVRILQSGGRSVEVQNYIDNTGVQVADVIVGLKYVEKKSLEAVRHMASDPAVKFDYYCWDVYAGDSFTNWKSRHSPSRTDSSGDRGEQQARVWPKSWQ
jgi:arginyl-tRNA synthetase